MYKFFLILCLGMLLACTGGENKTPETPSFAPISLKGANLEKGKKDYKTYCVKCHGDKGKGDGLQAKNFDVPPADFTENNLIKDMSNDEFARWIREGGKGFDRSPLMPEFGRVLSEEDVRDIIAYVRSLIS